MAWIVGAIIGGVIGAIISYLIVDRKTRAQTMQLALAEQRASEISNQLAEQKSLEESLRSENSSLERDHASISAQLVAANRKCDEQVKLLDDAREKLRDAFASVSAEALAKNNEAFLALAKEKFATISTEAQGSLDQRKAQIEGLLKPMQEMLHQYQNRLGEIEKSRVESYSMLREQLGSMVETQRTLNVQTNQLVSALRRPQTRGQWGEITLRRLVELSGMSNRCDFSEQTSVDTEDGKLRPDMIVHLPGNRTIIIDCKTSLDAFLDATSAADEDARKLFLQKHAQQVRNRSRELSAKAYWNQFKDSPEFVVMFLPGEAFLYAAVENDPELFDDCLKNRVIVATPTTLMPLLKAIEFGWRQEQIAENAEEIRQHGRDLYERLATLANHFSKLGASIDSVVANFNTTVGSMETRVMVTARKISELGAKTDKELPNLEPVDRQTRALTSGES